MAETRQILEKIADAMGFKLAVDEYFVFFMMKNDKHRVSRAYKSCMLEPFLYSYVFKVEKFYESVANPFYGCRSAEEALVRIDLLEGMR